MSSHVNLQWCPVRWLAECVNPLTGTFGKQYKGSYSGNQDQTFLKIPLSLHEASEVVGFLLGMACAGSFWALWYCFRQSERLTHSQQ